MAKKVTLHDIAIAANVADSTASKALTGTGRISAETRGEYGISQHNLDMPGQPPRLEQETAEPD